MTTEGLQPNITIGMDTPFLIAHTVLEHSEHERAKACFLRLLDSGIVFALCPTVIDEFLHVITDPNRFEFPLPMDRAIRLVLNWINSEETVLVFPTLESQRRHLEWMVEHRLGRKRINDTRIASIYYTEGITRLLTANTRDYSVFGVFGIPSGQQGQRSGPSGAVRAVPKGDGDQVCLNLQNETLARYSAF